MYFDPGSLSFKMLSAPREKVDSGKLSIVSINKSS